MFTIWKFPLELTDVQTVLIPQGAQMLNVQLQKAVPTVWALVDPKALKVKCKVRMIGTGHAIKEHPGLYVGTVQLIDEHEGLVFHYFIEKE